MSIQTTISVLKREVLEAWYIELRAQNEALLNELQETQLTLNDERNNLALAYAELRNLRAWQSLAQYEDTNQLNTQH